MVTNCIVPLPQDISGTCNSTKDKSQTTRLHWSLLASQHLVQDYVTILAIFGNRFPEFKAFCGKPVHLAKSMYGMTLSGKYWWMDLLEFILSLGFTSSKSIPCLLILTTKDGSIYVLNYIDDMLYFGTCEPDVTKFEEALKKCFNLELMGYAHWYLATHINQLANYDIELDQS